MICELLLAWKTLWLGHAPHVWDLSPWQIEQCAHLVGG